MFASAIGLCSPSTKYMYRQLKHFWSVPSFGRQRVGRSPALGWLSLSPIAQNSQLPSPRVLRNTVIPTALPSLQGWLKMILSSENNDLMALWHEGPGTNGTQPRNRSRVNVLRLLGCNYDTVSACSCHYNHKMSAAISSLSEGQITMARRMPAWWQ